MESPDSLVLCVVVIEQAFDTFLLPPPTVIPWYSQAQLQGWGQALAAWYRATKSWRNKGLTNLDKKHKKKKKIIGFPKTGAYLRNSLLTR